MHKLTHCCVWKDRFGSFFHVLVNSQAFSRPDPAILQPATFHVFSLEEVFQYHRRNEEVAFKG